MKVRYFAGCRRGALALVVSASAASAQEALPTIDIGAAVRGRTVAATGLTAAHSIPEDNTTYHPENATTALKTNTPIMQTPASVQVIPRAILQDQQVVTLGDAVNNVSGVLAQNEAQSGDPTFLLRGFISNNYYLDGLRINTFETGTRQNLANVDRIEVLKGPASILYGRADPGGIVNVVTKRPLETPYYSVQQQFGSWSDYRTTVDATGPLNSDKSLLYRMNFAYENRNQFWLFSNSHNVFVAPKLAWHPDESTQVNLFLQYSSSAHPDYDNFPAFTTLGPTSQNPLYTAIYGARPLSFLPRSRSINYPWRRGGGQDLIVGFDWSHDLNASWNIKQQFQLQKVDQYNVNGGWIGWTGGEPFQLDELAYSVPHFNQQVFSTNVALTGKFDTLGADHTLLIGSDYQHFHSRGDNLTNYLAEPINVLAPNYYPYNPLPFLDPAFNDPRQFGFTESWWGAYIQDQIKLPYDIFVLAGARYDHARYYDESEHVLASNAQKVTPRFGLLWQPIPEFSIYGSYLTNFGAPPTSAQLRPLPPQSARQWEVGVKTELFDKRLTATIAYYDLTKTNIPAPDPNAALAAQGYQVAIGEARNRGVELDVSGEILPGWKVIGSYSYIASIITNDGVCSDPANGVGSCIYDNYTDQLTGYGSSGPRLLLSAVGDKGKRLAGVPRHSGSLFTTYEFQEGLLKGLKIGGGALARSLAQGDNFNSYQLPGYATANLMAAYVTDVLDRKTTFQFNVDNLLDTRYYSTAYSGGVNVGAPRSFKGSIKVEF